MASTPQSGPTTLAGRLKNRLRRSVQHEAGQTAAPSLQPDTGTMESEIDDKQHLEFVLATKEPQPQPDLDDCAELSELLIAAAVDEADDEQPMLPPQQPQPPPSPAEQQLRAQLLSLAIENETLRARASQEESELVSRLRRQLSEQRTARLRAETVAADAAAAAAGAAGKPSSGGGPISRAVASLRRRRQARAAAAAAADAAAAEGVAAMPEGVPGASAAEDADLESLDSDSDAEPDDAPVGRRPKSFCSRLRVWAASQLLDLMEDLQQPTEADGAAAAAAAAADEPQLSARRLKANATRFGRNVRPLTRSLRGLQGVLRWRSPSYTALVIAIYYYALFHELLLPLLLLLCIGRLCLNYLKYRLHWSFEFNFVSDYELAEDEDGDDKERRVGTQVNLVVQVARKVQNLAGRVSDNMEKFKNLVTWRSPKHTQRLLNLLVAAFAVSVVLPSSTCLQLIGLYFGVKLFVIDALVARYPRLRRRFDGASKMWRALPTDQQLGSLQVSRDVEKYILPGSDDEDGGSSRKDHTGSQASVASNEEQPHQQQQQQQFCQTFSLPATEAPLSRWRGGKRCAIVCKVGERSLPLPSSLKHGKLYLTRSFLCFERSKDRGKARRRNLVIPLSMIRWLKKTKPFSWLPGGGMSIEVQIFGVEKPLIFGGIIGRDEVFDSLTEAGRRAGLPWAGGTNATGDSQQQQQQQLPQADPQLVQSVSQALLSDSDMED